MAYGDVKHSRASYGGGGGSYSDYDDEGRGMSKSYWERFSESFKDSGYDCQFLLKRLPENNPRFIYEFWRHSTYRYNKDDWGDRARELVTKKCGRSVWDKFSGEILDHAKEYEMDRKWMLSFWRDQENRKYAIRAAEDRKAREAQRLILVEQETREIRNEVEATAGMLQSDIAQALKLKEIYYQKQGEWLDDPVEAYTTGYGFGEEYQEAAGNKLQITVSLDLSNSMHYNNIADISQAAFLNLCLAVRALQEEHPEDIYASFFTFSLDEDSWDGHKPGRLARRLTESRYHANRDNEFNLKELEEFRPSADHWGRYGMFTGEDTWIYPLFEKIEKWENEESDSGAIRLDIIISDAVLEHPKDIRESNKIQERRNGNLQTVILNLMPEEHWINNSLPRKCVQYAANGENLQGMLRNIITEFVSMYV